MSDRAKSIYFIVFSLLYFGYTVFIAGHGIHWTNAIITITVLVLGVYFALKSRLKTKKVKH